MKYLPIQRILHWLIALMALAALSLGIMLDQYGFDGLKAAFGIETTNLIYKSHKTLGILILGSMVLRLFLRLNIEAPDYDPPLTTFEHIASHAVHGLLYLILLALPAVGWLATGASGFPVEFFNWNLPALLSKDPDLGKLLYGIHGAMAKVLFFLIIFHIAGALFHAIIKKDGVLSRML